MKKKVVYLDKNHKIVSEDEAYWIVETTYDEEGLVVDEKWSRPVRKEDVEMHREAKTKQEQTEVVNIQQEIEHLEELRKKKEISEQEYIQKIMPLCAKMQKIMQTMIPQSAMPSTMPTIPSTITSCPNCGTPATGRFCSSCGASLEQPTCPECGVKNVPGAKFCNNCGAVLEKKK